MTAKGRAAGFNTPNRFTSTHLEPLDIELPDEDRKHGIPTLFLRDASKSILARNDSPGPPVPATASTRIAAASTVASTAMHAHRTSTLGSPQDWISRREIMVKMDAARSVARRPLAGRTVDSRRWWRFRETRTAISPSRRRLGLTRAVP
jgi:hypothetical protein